MYQTFEKFDVVLAFVGSAACSPVLEAMLERNPNWDPRFFFSQWKLNLIEKLLELQEKLKKMGGNFENNFEKKIEKHFQKKFEKTLKKN